MTLALTAGTGDLPAALVARLSEKPLICALEGYFPAMPVDLPFRIEHLGTLLDKLDRMGVTEVCFAGAVQRPVIDPDAIDDATAPLVPRIAQALGQGDDGALRTIISIFEERGFAVRAAHDIAPDLLPPSGVQTKSAPQDWHRADARVGEGCIARMGRADAGQACIVQVSRIVATEGPDGTEAMIAQFHAPYDKGMADDPFAFVYDLASDAIDSAAEWLSGEAAKPITADHGILFKAPKPDQDRRADLPLIGPDTAMQAAEAGLAGIVIEAGGVMVLELDTVVQILDAQDMFLWVRPKGGA